MQDIAQETGIDPDLVARAAASLPNRGMGTTALVVSGLGGAGLIERTIFSGGTRKWFETMIRLMDALPDTVGGETDNNRDG